MRDMVQCDNCGKWHSYKYECNCEKKENINKKEDLNMEDLKVKNIISSLPTSGVIRFDWKDTGESFCPTIRAFTTYSEFYVTGLHARNNELVITIQEEI